MDPEPWKRVDALLHSALGLSADRQDDLLCRECGQDTELLEEVRSLLTSHRRAGSFLEWPWVRLVEVAAELPALNAASYSSPLTSGEVISQYRVLEPIGSGGIGVV